MARRNPLYDSTSDIDITVGKGVVIIVRLGPPYPLACTPTPIEYDWYSFDEPRTRTVEEEIESVADLAPNQRIALLWRGKIRARITKAREGSIPQQRDAIERIALQQGVYELKIPLVSGDRDVLLRMYQVDLNVADTPTIGAFLVTAKKVEGLESRQIRETQNSDIREAARRCDRVCRRAGVERLN